MSSAWNQFLLLLWKNFKLQSRKKIVTTLEIIVPIIFVMLLLLIRSVSHSTYISQNTTWQSVDVCTHPEYLTKTLICYTPSNNFTHDLIQAVVNYTRATTRLDVISDVCVDESCANCPSLWAIVNFTATSMSVIPPHNLNYALRVTLRDPKDRWHTANTYPLFGTSGFRNNDSTGGEPYYYETGFLYLQCIIDKAFIDLLTSNNLAEVAVAIEKMPYGPFLDDVLLTVLQPNLPLFLVLSFIINALQITKDIAYEKEKSLKESMKMMGLSTYIYWLSWFVKCIIYLLIVIFFFTIIFKIEIGDKGKILNLVEPTLFFCFLLCYVLATIAFCFMISTFFKKANTAAFAGGILFFMTYSPYFFLVNNYPTMTRSEKMIASLLHNIGMSFGVNTVLIYEQYGGAKWNNFHKPGVIDDNFSLLDAITMLLVDSVIYMVIAWYIDTINPGDVGVAQPPWFPFKRSYWCGSNVNSALHDDNDDGFKSSSFFEKDPNGAKVGISIHNLNKYFKNKVAVKGTTLNIYKGQITALLGHNGAGKTTTISMLTGLLEPSGGTAIVNGYDIRTDISKIRRTLGLCPQHNILFDRLTVEEHLQFFASLKGCERRNVKAEVEEMIMVLGLEQKRHALSSNLSGGQKRKLSVGIALIADSKIVILDEPTSGMDPAARRQTWDILQRYRKDRTIILTTHFMDEADILGDRIVIMSDGVVKCCGSSMFLKKLYGAGYHMVMVKGKSCNVDKLTKLIQSHIYAAEIESQISAEVSYLLPFNETNKFEKLFVDIETNMQALGVNSFGISATTMEEVFLKVVERSATEEDVSDDSASTGVTNINTPSTSTTSIETFEVKRNTGNKICNLNEKEVMPGIESNPIENCYQNEGYCSYHSADTVVPINKFPSNCAFFNQGIKKNSGMTLTRQQFYGMFVKHFIHARRNYILAAVQIILPVLFSILALSIEKALPKFGNETTLALDLKSFGDCVVTSSSGTNATNVSAEYETAYKNQFNNYLTESVDRDVYHAMNPFFLDKIDAFGIDTFNRRHIIAGDFQDTRGGNINATAYYNGQPFHAIAISLNAVMNGILKSVMNDSFSINVENFPLSINSSDTQKQQFFSVTGTGFVIAICVLFGMAFMAASFTMLLIKERSVGAKHLQVVSGVGPFAYWLSTFLWDIINYTIPVLFILLVFAAFQTQPYVNENRLLLVFLVFMLHGWSVLPFVYLLQYLFNVPATGMVSVSMINLCTGLVFLLTTFSLSIPTLGTEDISKALEVVFITFLPGYNFGLALMDMYSNSQYKDFCDKIHYEFVCRISPNPCCFPDNCGNFMCFTFYNNYLAWQKPGIGKECLFMALQGFVYFTVVILIEADILRRVLSKITKSNAHKLESPSDPLLQPEDDDVAEESQRINKTDIEALTETDVLILRDLSKKYGRDFHAVQGISCGVAKNECFGLLGQNGAGKTSTFKILTGDEQLTSGDAYLNKFSTRSNIKKVQQNLGYCPQFDALIDQMTGRETLYMYARLRGIEESQIKDTVNQVIDTLMLTKHADKETGLYSGGNKRKLSTAIALIGDPPVILLDEPTTGMDPGARRQLWNVLSDVRASGRTLILTSHSMEECDALCTRIVIMVNGKFVCLGSPQHLKNKFGHGYTLFCRMGFNNEVMSDSTPLVDFIQGHFRNTEVFDNNQGYVHFHIPDDNTKLAEVFAEMERAKEQFNVEDYSVHQTTLEQIFLTFTLNQVPLMKKQKGCLKTYCFCCCKT